MTEWIGFSIRISIFIMFECVVMCVLFYVARFRVLHATLWCNLFSIVPVTHKKEANSQISKTTTKKPFTLAFFSTNKIQNMNLHGFSVVKWNLWYGFMMTSKLCVSYFFVQLRTTNLEKHVNCSKVSLIHFIYIT